MEISGALTKLLPRQCGGNTQSLLYIGKKGCEMEKKKQKQTNKNSRLCVCVCVGGGSSGFTNELCPHGGAFSGNLLDQKSKPPPPPPLFSGGGRGYK